jgi:hypothetical protein
MMTSDEIGFGPSLPFILLSFLSEFKNMNIYEVRTVQTDPFLLNYCVKADRRRASFQQPTELSVPHPSPSFEMLRVFACSGVSCEVSTNS